MEDIFASIESDKRDRIINAAVEEFAQFPFEKASTNSIVRNAGISKGLLFHYFDSKQVLYDQLVGFVIHKLYDLIVDRIDWDQSDLFERIKQIAIIKMDISRTYPHMFDFLINMLAFKKTSRVEDIIDLYKGYGLDFRQINEDIYTRNVDYSKFKNPETIAEATNIVRWSLEKYGEEMLMKMREDAKLDFAHAVAGLEHYMSILKITFYAEPPTGEERAHDYR